KRRLGRSGEWEGVVYMQVLRRSSQLSVKQGFHIVRECTCPLRIRGVYIAPNAGPIPLMSIMMPSMAVGKRLRSLWAINFQHFDVGRYNMAGYCDR
ncbi:hypothetical protein A2U01_0060348, partial [Trifolium medium]|nr:hypothetical protein [Trifolium medium]